MLALCSPLPDPQAGPCPGHLACILGAAGLEGSRWIPGPIPLLRHPDNSQAQSSRFLGSPSYSQGVGDHGRGR